MRTFLRLMTHAEYTTPTHAVMPVERPKRARCTELEELSNITHYLTDPAYSRTLADAILRPLEKLKERHSSALPKDVELLSFGELLDPAVSILRSAEGRRRFEQGYIWVAGNVDQAELICVVFMVRALKAKCHIDQEALKEHLRAAYDAFVRRSTPKSKKQHNEWILQLG